MEVQCSLYSPTKCTERTTEIDNEKEAENEDIPEAKTINDVESAMN